MNLYVVQKSEFGAEMVTQYTKSKVELHNVSLKFRFSDLYVQEPIPKFWLRPRVLLKYAFKKIFKCNFSACVSSRNFLTKLSKLLMTHHLGIWPRKNFHFNFQFSKFSLWSRCFLKINFFEKSIPVWHTSDQGPKVNVHLKF